MERTLLNAQVECVRTEDKKSLYWRADETSVRAMVDDRQRVAELMTKLTVEAGVENLLKWWSTSYGDWLPRWVIAADERKADDPSHADHVRKLINEVHHRTSWEKMLLEIQTFRADIEGLWEHTHTERRTGPRWDQKTRTLLLDGIGIKTFKKNPAERQVELIEAFAKENFVEWIVNPFGVNEVALLRQTVDNLNNGLPLCSLRFRMDGTGEGVRWERAAE